MNSREAWAPNTGFDIFWISLTGIFEHETRHLIDRHPLRRLLHRVGYRNFQKSDRHAPGSHPIPQAALQRAQVVSDLVRGPQRVEWFDRLWMECPVRGEFADCSERMVAKRGVSGGADLLFAVTGQSEQADQHSPGLVNREPM